jgi:cytochrome c peroxidase
MRTAPYMHDGRADTIDEVLDIYRRVDRRADPRFEDLQIPDRGERADFMAFLQSASDGAFDKSVPASVPSGLGVARARRNRSQ